MTVKVANNAWGTLSVGVNDTDTTLLLGTAQGDRFPSLPASVAGNNDDYYYVTLVAETNELEIVRVIDRVNDVLTVVRAQEGTRRKQFLAGSRVELRPTAALFNSKKDVIEDKSEKAEIKSSIEKLENNMKDELEKCVRKEAQDLTDAEKQLSRDNIGAMSKDTDETVSGSKTWTKPQFFQNNLVLLQRSSTDRNGYALVGRMADNDAWIIRGMARTLNNDKNNQPTTVDNGYLEIATADNGTEPIYVSQYIGGNIPSVDQGSVTSWDGCFSQLYRRAVILDENGNTQFPGIMTIQGICYASNFQATSDKRLKFGFEELNESILDGITPYRYGRRDKNPKERFVGVIAQDVQEVLPEAVRTDGNGYLSVDYAALTAVLWGEVKRLKKIVEGLQNEAPEEPVKRTRRKVAK